MKRLNTQMANKIMAGFISLIYGQICFAEGGIMPTINGAKDVTEGTSLMEVFAGWAKTGMFIILCSSSIFLLTKSMNTLMLGLKKAQEEDGSITTMLNYLVSTLLAASIGLLCAYLGYEIYKNFNIAK